MELLQIAGYGSFLSLYDLVWVGGFIVIIMAIPGLK